LETSLASSENLEDNSKLAKNLEVSPIHFERIDDAFLAVPVRVNDQIDTYFILDTGVGVTILDKAISDQLGLKVTGSHSGKTMSGQTLHVDTSHVSSMTVGRLRKVNVPIGIWDLKKLLPDAPQYSKIGGFISLKSSERRTFYRRLWPWHYFHRKPRLASGAEKERNNRTDQS
jgi:hypothetical protein